MSDTRTELTDLKKHLTDMQAEFSAQIAQFQELVIAGLAARGGRGAAPAGAADAEIDEAPQLSNGPQVDAAGEDSVPTVDADTSGPVKATPHHPEGDAVGEVCATPAAAADAHAIDPVLAAP